MDLVQCHEDDEEDHPLAGMQPNAEGEEQEAEMVQALEDSIDVGILAEANVSKGGKSIECVFAPLHVDAASHTGGGICVRKGEDYAPSAKQPSVMCSLCRP
jgi:hypothetical protein